MAPRLEETLNRGRQDETQRPKIRSLCSIRHIASYRLHPPAPACAASNQFLGDSWQERNSA